VVRTDPEGKEMGTGPGRFRNSYDSISALMAKCSRSIAIWNGIGAAMVSAYAH